MGKKHSAEEGRLNLCLTGHAEFINGFLGCGGEVLLPALQILVICLVLRLFCGLFSSSSTSFHFCLFVFEAIPDFFLSALIEKCTGKLLRHVCWFCILLNF